MNECIENLDRGFKHNFLYKNTKKGKIFFFYTDSLLFQLLEKQQNKVKQQDKLCSQTSNIYILILRLELDTDPTVRLNIAVVANVRNHWSFQQKTCFKTSEANPINKSSIKKLSLEPWNVIHHANCSGTTKQTHQMKSCKAICSPLPSLHIQGCLRGHQKKKQKNLRWDDTPQSVCSNGDPVVYFSFVSPNFPNVPQGTREKVGISFSGQNQSVFSLHTSCHRVSQWD